MVVKNLSLHQQFSENKSLSSEKVYLVYFTKIYGVLTLINYTLSLTSIESQKHIFEHKTVEMDTFLITFVDTNTIGRFTRVISGALVLKTQSAENEGISV